MAEEFLQIFTEMGMVSAIFLTLGMILCIIEIFVPGVGFFGISGAICTILGIIFRLIDGMTFYQFLLITLMMAGVFALAICCLVILVKLNLIGDVGLFNTGTALPRDYGKNREYKKLIGKLGKTVTDMSLAGRVKVRGKIYDAISEDSFIEKNKYIKVVKLEDNRLVVRKYWE